MRRKNWGQALLALALAALLCACGANPKEELPGGREGGTSAPVGKTAQQLLEEQPRDEDHDAFLVDTGGRLGTLLVAVALEGRDGPDMQMSFSVWDPQSPDRPLQTMTKPLEALAAFGSPSVADADFDGYQDFGYMYLMGNQPAYWYYWLWDEARGAFTEAPALAEISWPTFDPEKKTVSGYERTSAATGIYTVHQWIDGQLLCVRRVSVDSEDWSNSESKALLVVEDRVNDALVQVHREERDWTEDLYEAAERWCDLDYHGES